MPRSTMHDKDQPGAAPDPARRGFLKAAPLGALLVAAGAAARTTSALAPPLAEPEPERKRGYQETPHVRDYYRTAAYW